MSQAVAPRRSFAAGHGSRLSRCVAHALSRAAAADTAPDVRRPACRAARLRARTAAGGPSTPPPPPPSVRLRLRLYRLAPRAQLPSLQADDDEEARLEALEARVRGVGGARKKPEAPPTINIRGQEPKKAPVVPLAERIKGKDGAWHRGFPTFTRERVKT